MDREVSQYGLHKRASPDSSESKKASDPAGWPRRVGQPKPLRPMKAIRANCLDCSEGPKSVAYCSCDGFHSTRCEFWSYRFGCRPETARLEFGQAMLAPELMPGPEVELESLPKNPRDYRPDISEKAEEGHIRVDSQQPTGEVV